MKTVDEFIELTSQNDTINNLYDILINQRPRVICLKGEDGCGKSTIVDKLINTLKEGWGIHLICGSNDAEYVARHSIKTNKRIEFFPAPSLSLRLTMLTLGATLRFQESDSIFCDVEKQFIKEINRDSDNSLVVVKNYHQLEDVTKRFVNTIACNNFFGNNTDDRSVTFLITSDQNVFPDALEVVPESLNTHDIEKIIKSMQMKGKIDTNQLIRVTHGNLSFILNILSYYKSGNRVDLSTLIEKRMAEISQKSRINDIEKIRDICTLGAYFRCGFSPSQILQIEPNYTEENLYDLFLNLDELGILEQQEEFLFRYTIEEFKILLKNQSQNLSCFYYKKLYDFYTKYYDHDYETRAEYLYAYLNTVEYRADNSKLQAILVLMIANKIFGQEIREKSQLDALLENIKTTYAGVDVDANIVLILYKLISGNLCENDLESVNFDDFDILLKAELIDLSINLKCKNCGSSESIDNCIRNAISLVEQLDDTTEYYIQLRLQSSILSLLVNRSTLDRIFDSQIEKLKGLIKNYRSRDNAIYQEFLNSYKRKSVMFAYCDICIRNLYDAVSYYEKNNNKYEQFKCYVNLMGVYISTGRQNHKDCQNLCAKAKLFLKDNKNVYLGPIYKYKNNELLLSYLKAKTKSFGAESNDLNRSYQIKFQKLYNTSRLKIARLNAISLQARFDADGALNEIEKFLSEFRRAYYFDKFYLFYLYNLECMIFIMRKDWMKAQQVLDEIVKIAPPFYDLRNEYAKKRCQALQTIISNKMICNNSDEYDDLIYKVLSSPNLVNPFIGLDESWNFLSRGFLMSDAQYFS